MELRRWAALFAVLALSGCGSRVSAGDVLAARATAPAVSPAPAPAVLRAVAPRESVPVAAAATGPVARTGPLGIVATARPLTHEHPRRKRVAVPPTVAARPAAAAPCPSGIPPLKLGQVGAFSGVAGPLTASGRVGLAVWAKAVNASGGVACRRVEIYSVDDGADPGRTAAAVSDLVRSKGVVALVGTFAELTQPSLQSAAERLKVPVVGGALVTYEWNRSPYLFPQGASLTSQAFALARQAVQDGKGRAGILYCVESPTCTSVGRELGGEVGKRAGLDVVYSAPVSIIATDYTAQCQNAKTAGAQSLALAMDGSSIARLVRSCAALGYRPTIITGSFVLGPVGAADPGIRRNGVLTVNVTAPWMLSDTPGQRAYQAAMKAHASAVPLDSGSLLAWTSGRLVEAAAARLSDRAGPLASADLVAALGRMEGETLGGLTPPLRFVSGKPAPDAKCVFYTRLSEDGWSAPRGSRAVCP